MEIIQWQKDGELCTLTKESSYLEVVRVISHEVLDMIVKEYSVHASYYELGMRVREVMRSGYRGSFTDEYGRLMLENLWGPIELWIANSGNLIVLDDIKDGI